MSTKAKLTFVGSIVTSISVVAYIHIVHKMERDDVKVGVQMDLERQQKKKENMQMIEDQKKLTEALIKAQLNEEA